MAIYDFFVSRNNSVSNTAAYVGHAGRLFYDSTNGVVKISDGTTPGGVFIPYNIATATTIGGIKAGAGANVSVDGTLTIDTAGLPLSFGDFTANANVLTLVNSDQNMVISTYGNAEIQLAGNIGFYRSNGLPPAPANRYFQASEDGQVRFTVPSADPVAGAVEIVGSLTGNIYPPVNTGVMLHVTGNNNDASRIYNDGIGAFTAYVGRRINGNLSFPTAVLAGDEIIRISSTGYDGTQVPGAGSARIVYQAIENYAPGAIGSNLSFWTCAIGSNTLSKIVTVDSASGLTATKATVIGNLTVNGNLIGNAITTTATIGTANVATINISAGTTTRAPLSFASGTNLTTAQTGAVEYDGRLFYATPQNNQRGLIKAAQSYILNTDRTILNQTANQSIFGVAVAVSSNTRYAYTLNLVLSKTANNITMGFAVGGTAVLLRHTYHATTTSTATLATLSTPSYLKNILSSGFDTSVTVTPALNGAGFFTLTVTGIINVTTGGTWDPLVAFSGLPGAGSYVATGSSIEIYPVGAANATVSIGSWT